MSANIQFENIPACLKALPNWILHRNKIPMQTSGLAASSTDPATWTTFETAIANAERFDGIGFVFTGTEFSGVDLDDVRDPQTGTVEQWAADLVGQLDSYTELSPSQSGVHIIVRGKIPKAIKRKKIEIYPDARYFTITGRKSSSVSANVETRDLSPLLARVQAGEFDTPEERAASEADASDEVAPILSGTRDNTLTSIGGKLRHAGLEFDEIRAALSRINAERCSPPLPSADIERIARSVSNYAIGRDESQDVLIGGIVAGTAPVVKQTAPTAVDVSKWADSFKSVSELESGDVQMLIDGFLPEGVTCIGALPAEGKTLFALSIAKALTTGEDFLGQLSFPVPRIVPVVYLIPESGARAFRRRCEKFRIPADRTLFLCRTISEGSTILWTP
jgi:Primase C terminal 1 (PriCT-1)/AAA domain